jgi:hypothetical protein
MYGNNRKRWINSYLKKNHPEYKPVKLLGETILCEKDEGYISRSAADRKKGKKN